MNEPCRRCRGSGHEPDDAMQICERCGGTGEEIRDQDGPVPIREPEDEWR